MIFEIILGAIFLINIFVLIYLKALFTHHSKKGSKKTTLKTALILAGGRGTRLEEHTEDLPKPLVPINGKPILERIIEWLKENGVENIIIGVAYKKEMIKNYFGDGKEFGVNIKYVEHSEKGGTEDAFKKDIEKSGIADENFYAMNGDQITDLDLQEIAKTHLKKNATVTIATVNLRTNFGVIETNKNQQIIEFKEKGEIYVFNKKIKNYLEGGNIEENAFRKLIKEGKIYSFNHEGAWLTVNNKKELEQAEEFLQGNNLK